MGEASGNWLSLLCELLSRRICDERGPKTMNSRILSLARFMMPRPLLALLSLLSPLLLPMPAFAQVYEKVFSFHDAATAQFAAEPREDLVGAGLGPGRDAASRKVGDQAVRGQHLLGFQWIVVLAEHRRQRHTRADRYRE